MNITLQNALKSSAFAIAIAFSGASYAAPAPVVTYNQNPVEGGMVFDADAKFPVECHLHRDLQCVRQGLGESAV